MKIKLSERAKDKGIKKVQVLAEQETQNYIACILHERRVKDGEEVDWVDPTIIFKTDVKSKDYDQAVRLLEETGVIVLLPECQNFKTDYSGITFDGYTTLVKSWGYTSNHLPKYRRWNNEEMDKKAKEWINDIATKARIIDQMIEINKTYPDDEDKISVAKEWLEENVLEAVIC